MWALRPISVSSGLVATTYSTSESGRFIGHLQFILPNLDIQGRNPKSYLLDTGEFSLMQNLDMLRIKPSKTRTCIFPWRIFKDINAKEDILHF